MTYNTKIRIDQFLAGFSPFDAISNEALIMQELLRAEGYISNIYAEHLHPKADNSALKHYLYTPDPEAENIAIYHFSIGSAVTTFLAYQPVKIIVRYHNVTPPEFFTLPSDHISYHVAKLGQKQLIILDQLAEGILADSEYNLRDFSKTQERIEQVIPVLRNYKTLLQKQDDEKLKNFLTGSDRSHWLFVGRIAPNKAQHDLIETLKIYQETVSPKTRLVLVGSFFSFDYKERLFSLCKALGLNFCTSIDEVNEQIDVLFLPFVSDETLKTAYSYSDLFLCLSDHEGFCVPIYEAASAGLSCVVHRSSAMELNKDLQDVMVDKANKVKLIEKIIETTSSNRTISFESMTNVAKQFVNTINSFTAHSI